MNDTERGFQKYAAESSLPPSDVKALLRPNQPSSTASLPPFRGNPAFPSKISPLLILGQLVCVCVAFCDDITKGAEGKKVGRRKRLGIDRDKTSLINYPAKHSCVSEVQCWLGSLLLPHRLFFPLLRQMDGGAAYALV